MCLWSEWIDKIDSFYSSMFPVLTYIQHSLIEHSTINHIESVQYEPKVTIKYLIETMIY